MPPFASRGSHTGLTLRKLSLPSLGGKNGKYGNNGWTVAAKYLGLVARLGRRQRALVKSHRQELWFDVPARRGFLNITPQIETALRASGIREGLCLVNAMHISASVFINDDERGLHSDFEKWLEGLAPEKPHSQYRHNDTGEDNADAHLKRTIMGREVVVAVTAGRLDFGPWEQIFYGEFDGHRKKRVLVKIIGE